MRKLTTISVIVLMSLITSTHSWSFTETTIAEVRYKNYGVWKVLSYRFMPRDKYERNNGCDDFDCALPEDASVIPVLTCSGHEDHKPAYISKESLVLALKKALEWAEVNKSAKVDVNKSLPADYGFLAAKLNFVGFEDGKSVVVTKSCPIADFQFQQLITDIENNYEAAYKKSFIDTDKLFQ